MKPFNVGVLIRDEIRAARSPDFQRIARKVFAKIPASEREAALLACLRDRVRIENHALRTSATTGGRETKVPAVGRSKWELAAPALRAIFSVSGEEKFFGDLTAEDCDWLADDRERRSAEQAAIAERFRKLARLLRAEGRATLAELGEASLEVAA